MTESALAICITRLSICKDDSFLPSLSGFDLLHRFRALL